MIKAVDFGGGRSWVEINGRTKLVGLRICCFFPETEIERGRQEKKWERGHTYNLYSFLGHLVTLPPPSRVLYVVVCLAVQGLQTNLVAKCDF
jgi:hypothetical protein